MKNKLFVIIITLVLMLSVLSIVACNKTPPEREIFYASPESYMMEYTFGDGVIPTRYSSFSNPYFFYAANYDVGTFASFSTPNINPNVNGGHFAYLKYFKDKPKPTYTYKGYKIYEISMNVDFYSSDRERVTSDVIFCYPDIYADNDKCEVKKTFILRFYEDDSVLESYSYDVKYGKEDKNFSCEFRSSVDIEILDIDIVMNIIWPIDKEEILPAFPFTLEKDTDFEFNFEADLDVRMPEYGSGYCEVEYRVVGEEKIRKSPVGRFEFQQESDYRNKIIDNHINGKS